MEGNQVRRYGVIRGRFQPFHNGHLRTCLRIIQSHEKLAVGIVVVRRDVAEEQLALWASQEVRRSIADSFARAKNPFSFVEVSEMVFGALCEAGVAPNRIVITPHFPPTVYDESLEFACAPPQADSILYIPQSGAHNVAGPQIYRKRGWTVVPLDLPPEKISATEVRGLIREQKNIGGLVPPFVERWISQNGGELRKSKIHECTL